MAGDERFGDGNDKINSEIWRETFFTSPQAMLIATADETLLEINDSARELLNLGNEDLNSETVDGLIGRLSAALKKNDPNATGLGAGCTNRIFVDLSL
jgi:hypothetical protein